MRLRKKPWTAAELANPIILRGDYKKNLPAYFENDNPIHLEIGCGKGQFISQISLKNPQINYIAAEREEIVLAAAARLATSLAAPCLFVLMDAADILDYFNPGEIERLYINFCDPWHRRKKWAKRRLTHSNFIKLYETLKIPEISLKTDNRILFEFSINQFSERGWLLKDISLDLHNKFQMNLSDEENIMTEYEEKFATKGPIYFLTSRIPLTKFEASVREPGSKQQPTES